VDKKSGKKVTFYFGKDSEVSKSLDSSKISSEKEAEATKYRERVIQQELLIKKLHTEINTLNIRLSEEKDLRIKSDKSKGLETIIKELREKNKSIESNLNILETKYKNLLEISKARLEVIKNLRVHEGLIHNDPPKKVVEKKTEAAFVKTNIVHEQYKKQSPHKKGMVSVIVPNFNTESYIDKAIESILNQTYQNFEILVIDDNSTDRSIEFLDRFKNLSNVHIYRSKINVGPYWLKNSLIDKLNGEYITVLDSDDIDVEIKLEEQVKVFEKNKKIKCVTCSYHRHGSNPSLGYPSMMFKREVFNKVGYYDSVRFAADSEFFERVKLTFGKDSIHHINKVLSKGPRRDEGLTGLVPENNPIRKKYFNAALEWHKSTKTPYIEFPLKKRYFSADQKMINDREPEFYQIEKLENNTDILPIVMCVWKRIEGFDIVVNQFNNQTFKNFKLFVWNNNPEYRKEFEKILSTANFEWEIYHSEENIGGFGRFYMGSRIRRTPGLSNYMVFVDDDQRWGPNLLQTFWEEREPKSIKAQFGWRFDGDDYYRNRVLVKPGESLHYAGTGGMILDSSVLEDAELYNQCIEDYWWVEDLWLSYWASTKHGYKLIKSRAEVKNGDDEHSLYRIVKDKKTPMLRWLLEDGKWNILTSPKIKISTIMMSYLGDYPGARSNPVEKFHRAFRSWLNQTYPNKELVIVSDGCEITNREARKWLHLPHVKLVELKKSAKKWPGANRQVGRDHATGDWITYLDTDDMYEPTFLERIQKEIEKNPSEKALLNLTLAQRISIQDWNKREDFQTQVLLRPVRFAKGSTPPNFELDGKRYYWASRTGSSSHFSTSTIIHHKSLEAKWSDEETRGEDILFSNRFKDHAKRINVPGYLTCHITGRLDI